MTAVYFYISGHGFGHAVRQIEIINALLATAPGRLDIHVRTGAPAWLFERTLRGPVRLEPGEVDTGAVQIDSLHLDERATVTRALDFYATAAARVDAEAARLRAHRARLVVADAPPLACAAAARAGIPAIVCSNFTWDWIYAAYGSAADLPPDGGSDGAAGRSEHDEAAHPDPARHLVTLTAAMYGTAESGWRLPMYGGFETVSNLRDLPFVARHARPDRTPTQLRTALGLPLDRPLALASFGRYGVRELPLERLDCRDSWGIVLTGVTGPQPPWVHCVRDETLYAEGLRYEDLVRAVDVVVTKPGYGIISDCVANSTAIAYTSRGRFAEYDVLVREMPRYLRCAYMDAEEFRLGVWRRGLDAAVAAPAVAAPRTDGADVAAGMILARLGLT